VSGGEGVDDGVSSVTDTAAAAAAVGGAGRLAAQAVSPTAALGYYLLPGYQAPYSTGTSSKVTHYYASAAVTVDSSHMIASSSASWSRFSPTSNFVNFVYMLTMCFMVCRWPQSQEGDWARPHLCKLARHVDLSRNS